MSIHLYLSREGELLVDPDQLGDLARPGTTSGPTGTAVAKRAKVKLVDDIKGVPRLALNEVSKFLEAQAKFDAEEADQRSRYEKFMDARREARRRRVIERAELEAKRREAERQAAHEANHENFLRERARAEAARKELAAKEPLREELDPELNAWVEAGRPEEPPEAPPLPVFPDEVSAR